MKNLAILLLSTFSLCASAQNVKNNLKHTITDDGKTMRITVQTNKNGKEISYDRTFAITGMAQQQKDALIKRVNDSLGIEPPPAPPAPHVPASTSTKNNTSRSQTEEKTVKDDGKTLHILVISTNDGKEVNYNKTFPVKGLSKQQKDAMVKRIIDSLGVSR